MRLRQIVTHSFFALFAGASCLAEDTSSNWFFRAWQTEDGLPDNTISGVAQSPDGYLWVGTNGGAMRFNGVQFSPLPLRNIPELPSREVQAMLLDRAGRLWLALTRGPVVRIEEDAFHAFHHDDGLFAQRAISMADDSAGRIWIVYTEGVCRIEGDEVTRFGVEQGIPSSGIASLTSDAEGNVWLAIGGKLGRLGDDGYEVVREFGEPWVTVAAARESGIWLAAQSDLMLLDESGQFSNVARLPEGSRVRTLFEDRHGAVWAGTQEAGLFRVEGGAVESVATSHNSVSSISEDREGNIWVGTRGGGLNLIRPRAVEFVDSAAGLPFSSAQSITCDSLGRIWAVSRDGRLAYRESDQWKLYQTSEGDGAMNCVAADPEGGVWIGTRNRGLLKLDGEDLTWFRKRDGLASLFVRSLFVGSNGDLWIATDRPDQLHRLRDGEITPIKHSGSPQAFRAMAQSTDGTIWIGSSDGRLFRVSGDRLVDESDLDGPLHLSIRTLHTTRDGNLWIGYAGDGLGHLKDGRYTRITSEQGLHDDYISQIQDDGGESLWMAANRGLFQVDLDDLLAVASDPSINLRCRVFGRSDGVPSIQPSRNNAPTACRSPDGRLYFSTHSGIVDVHPNQIRENTLPPPVTLERAIVDNETVAIYKARSMHHSESTAAQTDLSLSDPRLALSPGHDKLVIHFAALSLASPENVQMRYRMSPIDKDWVEAEGRRSMTFSRLPAGDYEFQVIACNNAGVWNEAGATLGIVVHPFFWETWWFRIGGGALTALAAGGVVFLGQRRKHRSQLRQIAAKQALEQERSRIARDIHDDLGASLTRITLLSQSDAGTEKDASEASVLDQIYTTSQHLMRSMEEVVWAVNPEHDTFDALANYLSNYGQGFLGVAGVRCRLELPMSLPERPLSAQIRHNLFLAFKEALNNAVKHANPNEVRISLDLKQDAFVLKVEDDGEGIDPNASAAPMRPTSGSGLANMKNRMEEIGGTCVLQSTLGKGTTVEFRVPFKGTQ